jgi:hypothetical protein
MKLVLVFIFLQFLDNVKKAVQAKISRQPETAVVQMMCDFSFSLSFIY